MISRETVTAMMNLKIRRLARWIRMHYILIRAHIVISDMNMVMREGQRDTYE